MVVSVRGAAVRCRPQIVPGRGFVMMGEGSPGREERVPIGRVECKLLGHALLATAQIASVYSLEQLKGLIARSL